MRRLAPLGLTLLGAALGIPAGVEAGPPEWTPQGGGPAQVASPHVHAPAPGTTAGHGTSCMCPDCQVKRAIEKAEGAPVVIIGSGPNMPAASAPCAACQTGSGPAPGHAAPGYAGIGGEAPGYASVGGAGAAGEPQPIGVIQANYAQPAPVGPARFGGGIPAQGPARGPGGAPGLAPGGAPGAGSMAVAPSNPWISPGPRRRTSVVGHMLGLGALGRLREAREERAAAAHAAIPMGMTRSGPVTDLPASMVYGNGH